MSGGGLGKGGRERRAVARSRLVAASCALAAALVAAPITAGAAEVGAPAAQAAKPKGKGKKGKRRGGKELTRLTRAGCAPYRAITQRKHSSEARREARRWKFEVYHFKTRLRPPVNWDMNPHRSRSFRQNLHGFAWMDTLLYAYRRSGDRTTLRRARDIALDWIRSNPRRFRPGRKGFAWHPKTAADRAGYLGFLTRAAGCKGLLNRKQARDMVRSLNAHAKYLANAGQHQASNFGLFQDLGLLLLSDYLSFERKSAQWRKLAVARFPNTLAGRLSSEHVWLEHSSQYQFLAIRLLNEFIKRKPGRKRDRGLSATLRRMRAAATWFVKPDGRYALLGDTQIATAPQWGYNEKADPRGLQAFGESGFAMVREGASYLAATAGFFNLTHKHADELDFDLFDRGLQIVSGPGNYGYDRHAAFRAYQLSSQSHSVLVADQTSFPITAGNEYGSAIRATGQGAGWFAIEGTNPLLARQGVAHSRLFLYRPGDTLAVLDRLRAAEPHTYHRFFQLGPEIDAQPLSTGTLGLTAESFAGGLHDAAAGAGTADRILVKGRTDPLQGFTFPGFRQAVPRWSVELRSQAANADHITTFTLAGTRRRGEVLSAGEAETRVAFTAPSGAREALRVTRSGERLSVSRLP